MKLLHVSASPRGERSESLALATAFLDALGAADPDVEIDHFDLWDGTLPSFGPAAADAKMAVFTGAAPNGPEAEAWHRVEQTFERFDAAFQTLTWWFS